jgi:hypothetical protein
MNHYVYKITFQNQPYVYYGSRSCECLPEEDTEYLGSPKTYKNYWIDFEPQKYIISTFDSREDANSFEDFCISIQWYKTENSKSLSLNAHIRNTTFTRFSKYKDKKFGYFLISPEGQMFSGDYLYDFVKENNLCITRTIHLITGKIKQYCGWTTCFKHHLLCKYYNTTEERIVKPPVKLIRFEDRKEFLVFSVKQFAREHSISSTALQRIVNGVGLISYGFCLEVNLQAIEKEREKFKNRQKILIDNFDLSDSEIYSLIIKEEPERSKTAIYSWIHQKRKQIKLTLV